MSVKSGQAVTVIFTTANPATGAAADATGDPAGTLYVNGVANAAAVTVTNITTGVYKAALTLPALNAGDVVSLRIAATVAAVAGEGVVWQEVADTKRVSDLTDAPDVSADVTAIKAKTDNLPASPAAVGSAMTLTAAYDAAKTAASQTSVNTIDDLLDTEIAAILEDTGTTLPGLIAALNDPTTGEIGDAVLDEVVEGAYTMRELLRLFASALGAKASGGGTATIVFRDLADSKPRITMTVDADGNRTVSILDLT